MKQIATRIVYENAWMTVREDDVRRADGSEGIYGVVEKPDFAVVLPRTSDGFWLVEQHRYPINRRAWEFPMGSWPPGITGTQLDLAKQELAEETGLRADRWEHLGHLYQAYGFSTQAFDVFLATGFTEGDTSREATELDMVHQAFTDAEITEMVLSGQIVDASTLAALTLFRLRN